MRISARLIASFVNFSPQRPGGAILALAAFVALAVASDPAAARLRPGAYDGTWNVQFITKAGNCGSNNSAPFNVLGMRVSSAGGGKVSGGVSPRGAVFVHISLGLSQASGTGRLVGNAGAGRWSGVISGDRCSGIWQASRT